MAPRQQNARSARAVESRRTRGIQSYRCRVCRGIHPLRKCARFLKLSAEKRLRAVLINKYCANCLAHEHSTGDCRSGDRCKKCDRSHHTLLHMHEQVSSLSRSRARSRRQPVPTRQAASASSQRSRRHNPPTQRRSSPPRRPESTTPGPSLSSLLQRHSVNILPTALVKLETGTKTFETAALIDPCSPMSCIDASLASAFKLSMTNVGDEKVCTTAIRSRIDANTKLEVVLKIEPRVRIRTPVRALSDTVVSKYRDIMLADDGFHRPATVSMVLGADIYPKVIQSGFLTFDEGMPVAQKTVFGWIVSGACSLP